jgi:two-component system chemotaxis sensor kinase CheA
MAIPLSMVARLEEFPAAHVERTGAREVVQYRGEILPLISLPAYFEGRPGAASGMRQVIVFAGRHHSVGLVVEEILDIVTETVTVSPTGARRGVLGSAIIGQRVTDLLDVEAIVEDADRRAGTISAAA